MRTNQMFWFLSETRNLEILTRDLQLDFTELETLQIIKCIQNSEQVKQEKMGMAESMRH